MRTTLIRVIPWIVIPLVLLMTMRGQPGPPLANQAPDNRDTSIGGPFESSGNSSRYVLTESIVEDQTVFLDEGRAAFASPDVSEMNGRFFSLFTPGVSFLGIPWYLIGKTIGLPQLVTFMSTQAFAVLNMFLVAMLAVTFGASRAAGLLAGSLFLLGTNALPYSLGFTQHHASTATVLLSLLTAQRKRTVFNNVYLGALIGLGILIDIPNIFLTLPILIFVFWRHVTLSATNRTFTLSVNMAWIAIVAGLVPFLAIFGQYNQMLTGSPTMLAQNLGRTGRFSEGITLDVEQAATESDAAKPRLPFHSRLLTNGLHILMLSDERGIFYYSPILVIAVAGLTLLLRRRSEKRSPLSGQNRYSMLLLSVVSMNILMYAMFGDPWGGWAFGPRYLIPATAILATCIPLAIDRWGKNPAFMIPFFMLAAISVWISTVGALTTNQIPPKGEAERLPSPIPYTFHYNLDLLDKGFSSSLVYNLWLSPMLPARVYALFVTGSSILSISLLYALSISAKQTVRRPP